MKKEIFVFILVFLLARIYGVDIQKVNVTYTAGGVSKSLDVLANTTKSISRDKGTPINIRIYKSTTAPATSTFTLACYPTGGGFERTTSNASELFTNVGDALTNDIWCMVNVVSGLIRIQPVDLPTGYPDLSPINREVDGSVSSSYKEFFVGQTVDVDCGIYNNGQGDAGTHRTGFYIGTSSSDYTNRFDYNTTGSTPIKPGLVESESTTYTFSATDIGTRYFNFWADYQDVIEEGTAEGNNKQSWGPFTVKEVPLGLDFTQPATNLSITQGQTVTLTWAGSGTGATSVSLRRDNDNIWENGSGELWIAIGQPVSGSYVWDTKDVPAGTYYVAGAVFNTTTYEYDYASGKIVISPNTSDLTLSIKNIDGNGSPLPGNEGRVKLFNSIGAQIGDELPTNDLGQVTFADVPDGTEYYYEVYHDPINPTTPFGLEYWGKRTGLTISSGSVSEAFTRSQPYGGEVHIFNGVTEVTGQTVTPGTLLTVEYTMFNPIITSQSGKSRVLIDQSKSDQIDFPFQGDLVPISGNGTKQSFTFTPTNPGSYYVAGGVDISPNNTPKITDGGKWSDQPFFTISSTTTLQITKVIANRIDQVGGNHVTISKNAFIAGNLDRFATHLDADQTKSCLKYIREKLWVQVTIYNPTQSQKIGTIYTGIMFPNSNSIDLSEKIGWAFILNPQETKLLNIPVSPPLGNPLSPYENIIDGEYKVYFRVENDWPASPQLVVDVNSNLINPPQNSSIGKVLRMDYSVYENPPPTIDIYNGFAGLANIFSIVFLGDELIPVIEQGEDLFENERIAFATAAKTEIDLIQTEFNLTRLQTKWKDQTVYPDGDRPPTIILFDRATSIIDIKTSPDASYAVINNPELASSIKTYSDEQGFKHTMAAWFDYGVDKQLRSNSWYEKEISISHTSKIEVTYGVQLEMGPFKGKPYVEENGAIIDYNKWQLSPNDVYWVTISADMAQLVSAGTGIQNITSNLTINQPGIVKVQVIAPSDGNYYLKVFNDNLKNPEWNWSKTESSLISLTSGSSHNFEFTVTPNTYSEGFQFWLYKQSWIPGIFFVSEKILETLYASGIPTNIESIISDNVIIYPNPNKGILNIDIKSNSSEDLNIEIYNSVGIKVYEKKDIKESQKRITQINLKSLSNGKYVVHVYGTKINEKHSLIMQK